METPVGVSDPTPPALLRGILEESRRFGFLGPGEVGFHVKHSLGFAAAWDLAQAPAHAVDLGSGGGVPGLVLAVMAWPPTTWTLIDSAERRCAFLRGAIEDLGVGARVTVHRDRAEAAGRLPQLRHTADLVVSRSFAIPPVTAECGSPFLAEGGRLIVSEPPTESEVERWPASGLAELGLRRVAPGSVTEHHYAVFEQQSVCSDRYPRAIGRPAKRPLF